MSRQPTNTSSPSGGGGTVGAPNLMMGGLVMDSAPTGFTPTGMGFTPNVPGIDSSPRNGAALNGATLNGANTGTGIPQAGMTAQDQEAARTEKIATITRMLSPRLGWVSQSGLERAAKRVRLEFMWEDDLPTSVGPVDQNKERTLGIAGNGVLVEVHFRGDVVRGVSLSYPEHGTGVGGFAAQGAAVLKSGLQGIGEEGGFVALESFVRDLEALARMDKLSGRGVSAFDAVDGIRTALEKIWAFETVKVREGQSGEGRSAEYTERMVLCRGSGKPRMHAGRRVGLSLQYWMARHKVTPERRYRGPDDMDVDNREGQTMMREDEETIDALVIECEAQSPDIYPPIRVSTDWISTAVSTDKVPETSGIALPLPTAVDWQDPAPTHLSQAPAESLPSDDLLASTSSLPVLPSIRFVAKLSSPIVMPLHIAMQLLSTLNVSLSQESLQQHQQNTYETLLLSDLLPPGTLPSDPFTKDILAYTADGEQNMGRHRYELFPLQPVLGFKITEVPFSHPRQIVNILPVLRQWTLAGQMLRRCFTAAASNEDQSGARTEGPVANGNRHREGQEMHRTVEITGGEHAESDESTSDDESDEEFETLDDELAAMLAPKDLAQGAYSGATFGTQAHALRTPMPVDISFGIPTATGSPILRVIYTSGHSPSHFSFEVLGNGIINVTDVVLKDSPSHIDKGANYGQATEREKEIVKAILEVSEDIGTTVAYLCS